MPKDTANAVPILLIPSSFNGLQLFSADHKSAFPKNLTEPPGTIKEKLTRMAAMRA
jgi:hypothetical protein